MKTYAATLFLGRGLVSSLVRYGLAVSIAGALAGCNDGGERGAGAGDSDLGQVSLSLSAVPADIHCLRVTGAGTDRTITRPLEITAGQPLGATLTGVPLGPVVFTAQAFEKTCDDVTASTAAEWVSDPTTVSVALGHLTSVELTMHRNGRTKVSIDFPDEPICSPAGAACASATTCCSRGCSKGVCKAAADAGSGDDDAN